MTVSFLITLFLNCTYKMQSQVYPTKSIILKWSLPMVLFTSATAFCTLSDPLRSLLCLHWDSFCNVKFTCFLDELLALVSNHFRGMLSLSTVFEKLECCDLLTTDLRCHSCEFQSLIVNCTYRWNTVWYFNTYIHWIMLK